MNDKDELPPAQPDSQLGKQADAATRGPADDIRSVITSLYDQAAALHLTDPKEARWLRSKARYLERGLLKLALEFEGGRQRSQSADAWRSYKYDFNWHIECTRALVQLSQNALKIAALINAGAAVALLAFLGNTWDSGIDVSQFATALGWFAAGLVIAALASGAGYAAQLYYLKQQTEALGAIWHKAAAVLFVAALVIFGSGCWITYRAFVDGPAQEQSTMTEREPPSSPPRPEPRPGPRPNQPNPRTDEPGKIAPPPDRPPGQPRVPNKPGRS